MINRIKSAFKVLTGNYIVLKYNCSNLIQTDLNKDQLKEAACEFYRCVYMQ